MRGQIEMRSDYVLYSVAVIFFIISAVFAASLVSGYQLGDPLGPAVTAVFLVIGIISMAVGYFARPKVMIQSTELRPAAAVEPTPEPLQSEIRSPPAPEPEMLAPAPMPSPTPSIETPGPSVTEPSATEATASEITAVETSAETVQPVKVEEVEKPKPTRRRRKKTE